MARCVYTTQKTKKKAKKWLDAEVEVRKKRLVLRDDAGKIVCSTTSFELVDDTIVTPTCMIYADNIEELLKDMRGCETKQREDSNCEDAPTGAPQKIDVVNEKPLQNSQNVPESGVSEKRLKGRDLYEMLKLIKKD